MVACNSEDVTLMEPVILYWFPQYRSEFCRGAGGVVLPQFLKMGLAIALRVSESPGVPSS